MSVRRMWTVAVVLFTALVVAGCQTVPVTSPLPPPGKTPVVSTQDAKPGTAGVVPSRPPMPPPPRLSVPAQEVLVQLRGQLHEEHCYEGAAVAQWRRRYAGSPTRFAAEIERSLPLMAYVLEQIQARDLPGEFAFIPIVESWYRTDALARGGPAGMWQMIPATARGNGVLITEGYDGRYSAFDSTQAALDHLGDLQQRFGDWRLAAMAYNAGEHRLARAVGRHGPELVASGERRQPDGLAAGTYEYISKIKALSCLISEPERFRVELPDAVEVARLAPLDIGAYRGPIDTLADHLGIDADELTALNRGYASARVGSRGPATLLVPLEAANSAPEAGALVALASPSAPPATGTATIHASANYVVRRGDTLSAIAARQGVALRRLLRLNGLSEQSIIRPGQRIKLAP